MAHHPLAPGIDGGLSAVGQVELAQDVADVALDGVLADNQQLGNLTVGTPPGNEP